LITELKTQGIIGGPTPKIEKPTKKTFSWGYTNEEANPLKFGKL
jgi:hypothetical protein